LTERLESGSVSDSSNPFKFVNEFYEANSDLLAPRSRELDGEGLKIVEDSIGNFTEKAQTIAKGLHALSQVHPFIGGTFTHFFHFAHSCNAYFLVAVGAFVLVITLDLTRRDNDRKVLAVKLQMQDLMSVFFEYEFCSCFSLMYLILVQTS